MKKTFFLICTAILSVCLLSGCVVLPGINITESQESEDPSESFVTEPKSTETEYIGPEDSDLKALQEEIAKSGCAAGMAFIGYVDSRLGEADLFTYIEISKTCQKYPFIIYAPLFIVEGQELYAIVPANENCRITLYPATMTEYGEYADDKSNPLYEGEPGETVLLRCNLSEIYSNVLIAADDGLSTVEFRPALSMENGHIAETEGVYDFLIYEEMPDESSVHIAMEVLMETEEVKTFMMQGMCLMYTGDIQVINDHTCLLFALGTDREEQFVRERYYGVCGSLIYVYDEVSDTWTPLGVG